MLSLVRVRLGLRTFPPARPSPSSMRVTRAMAAAGAPPPPEQEAPKLPRRWPKLQPESATAVDGDTKPTAAALRGRARGAVKIEYEEDAAKPSVSARGAEAATPTANAGGRARKAAAAAASPRAKARGESAATAAAPKSPPATKAKGSSSSSATTPLSPASAAIHAHKPPGDWPEVMAAIKAMRAPGGIAHPAAVDTMGCDRCHELDASPKEKRFHALVAAMLSSQTRDEITHAAMLRLRAHGLTPQHVLETDEETLKTLLKPVGFYPRKAGFLQRTAAVLLEKYDGDVPDSVEALMELPGVGPKMAYLVMNVAWGQAAGICVDVHVDRISARLGWTPETLPGRKNRTPEDTRKVLEAWLPQSEWVEINPLLVGFGQTICTPLRPKCAGCQINHLCPSAFKEAASPSKSPPPSAKKAKK